MTSKRRGKSRGNDALAVLLQSLNCADYEPCMTLYVCEQSQSVELLLDTSLASYGEWIPGEGADICLIRDMETNKVNGVHLPLRNSKLSVWHGGPLKINEGFKRFEKEQR